ncbi:cytochrome P450 [Amylibacter sp. IMCC11727]|uniref:cytochrome P450 n=1 Tax=Amylibacter sp. IMCC11727 TaxID=3039851 RepID=UPI00244DB0FA|nr:cytochrome P450 [Amylibacter sp. IMCC11727]WGI22392.1 cytochrome P450 [Amylibacter sp. IMCC11727]
MPDGQMTREQPPKVELVTRIMSIWETLQLARKNLIAIIPQVAVKQPIVTGKTGIIRWHMVMDPTANRRILKDKLDIYPKSDVTKNILRPAIGDSMFIAEGAHWRWQRRAAAPVFSHRNIAALAPIMSARAQAASDRLAAANGEADVFDEMVRTTFEVISDVTFSGSGAMDPDAVHRAIDAYIDQTARVSLFDIMGVPTWVPRLSRLFGPNSLTKMKEIADQSINARRASGPKDIPDLLDLLMEGEDPKSGRQMNQSELRDNLLAFIVAGHETTALTLGWALYLCAFDPKVQEKLRAESQSVLNGRTATYDDVTKMPYCEQVIKETLRLYPPAAFLSRTAQDADTLCGRNIKPKDTVMLPVYALHRNELLWDDPDTFDPDRFGKGAEYDRFSWLPFGDGPRVCIGSHFAMIEAQIILSTLISRFKFERIPGKDPKPVLVVTLRPEGGVPLKVTPV